MEDKPEVVIEQSKQAGDIRVRWNWVEPSIWTERMLTALETGVKGGKWFSLIDKVYFKRNLEEAFERVRANKGKSGVDHVTVEKFCEKLEENIEDLHKSIKEGKYDPQAIKRVNIPKNCGKETRPLGIPTVRDRVVQTALKQVIEPIFEREFSENSYGFRPGRGCKDALRRVDNLLKEGRLYVVDIDIEKYFDSIPQDRLMKAVEEKISDSRVTDLIQSFLEQDIMGELETWQPDKGTPQGGVISPILANLYLNPLDHLMEREGYDMIRYADDSIVMCGSEKEAIEVKKRIEIWMHDMGLELHPEKTRIVNMKELGSCFEYLGYHFERGSRSGKIRRWPRQKSLRKIKDNIRAKTHRCNGKSLKGIVTAINVSLKGWFGYYKHSSYWTFRDLDQWIRMRLRSILRKRSRRKGCGRGSDHQRWPNTFFAENGLFSLFTAYKSACQSSRR